MKEMKEIKVIIEMSSEGRYSCYMENGDDLDYSVIGTGGTSEEAKQDFEKAYAGMRDHYASQGKEFEEIKRSFELDFASVLDFYQQKLTIDGLHRITGVSQGKLQDYAAGNRRPTRTTVAKIQAALNDFGRAMSRVALM